MNEINNEKKQAMRSLKTARGQIDGILKMIEDGRYCMDVTNQISASQALLRRSQVLILKQHLSNCVREACLSDNGEEKIDEIMSILDKVIK